MSSKHFRKLSEIQSILHALACGGDEQAERLSTYLANHLKVLERREQKQRSRYTYLHEGKIE